MKNKGIILIPVTVLGLAGLATLAYFLLRKRTPVVEATKTEIDKTGTDVQDYAKPPADTVLDKIPPPLTEQDNIHIDTTPVDLVPDADSTDEVVQDYAKPPADPIIYEPVLPEKIDIVALTKEIYADIGLTYFKQYTTIYQGLKAIGTTFFGKPYTIEKWELATKMNFPEYADEIILYRKQVGTEKALEYFSAYAPK